MSAITPTLPAPTAPARWSRVLGLGALVALLVAGGLVMGTGPRLNRERAVQEQAATSAAQPPRVATAIATRVAPDAERVLPGNCLPLTEIAIYPRTTGYLKVWKADIGDRVKAGQLLAEIATPEIDAQLEQARSTLVQSKANLVRGQAQEVYALAEEKREAALFKVGAEGRVIARKHL